MCFVFVLFEAGHNFFFFNFRISKTILINIYNNPGKTQTYLFKILYTLSMDERKN